MRICEPSTSASVIITTLWYLNFDTSNSWLPIPAPSAVMRVPISVEPRILSCLDFHVLSILPLRGSIAWFCLLRPCFAEPPAESPSTINISDNFGSFSWQSASFPGRLVISKAVFLLVSSLAFLAASLASAAFWIFCTIAFAIVGFSSNQDVNLSLIKLSTTGLTSEETSLSLVWDENFGSWTFTDKTQVKPSLMSSPLNDIWFFFPDEPLS